MGDPRYSKLPDGTLMIENILDSDVGVYECMAKSPAGEAMSRAARMLYQKTKGKPYKTTNMMHWILFIHQILLLSSTCFEYQVLIFRRT